MDAKKVKLEFKTPKNRIIEHNGVEIEVTPFLSVAEIAFLINHYTEEYFKKDTTSMVNDSDYNYLGAEFNLENYIFQMNTNIDTTDMSNDLYCDVILWEKVTSEIINFNDFIRKLHMVIAEIKEQRILANSLGTVINGLVEKVYDILGKVSNITPEQIEQARVSGLELIEKLEKSSVLDNTMNNTMKIAPITPEVPMKKTRKKRVQ